MPEERKGLLFIFRVFNHVVVRLDHVDLGLGRGGRLGHAALSIGSARAMDAAAIGDDELAAWLRLIETPGVGPATCRALLGAFGMPDAVFSASREALARDRYADDRAMRCGVAVA